MATSTMSDHEEDEDEMEEYEEGPDLFEALGGLLATEDGETIPFILNKLLLQFEMQNKILIKLVTAIRDSKSAS